MEDTFQPTCHSCKGREAPFAVKLVALSYQHKCGAVICPACGGESQEGDFLCKECRAATTQKGVASSVEGD